jgi:hypothetical protein
MPPKLKRLKRKKKRGLFGEKQDGLSEFLENYQKEVLQLRDTFDNNLIILNIKGPKILPVLPRNKVHLMDCVPAIKWVCQSHLAHEVDRSQEVDSWLDHPLTDHLWYLHARYPKFLETMSLLDPLGEGDCGFITLELFEMFLNPTTCCWGVVRMREALVKELKRDLDYFKSSRIQAAMLRPPHVTDGAWKEREEMTLITQSLDLTDEDNPGQDSLYNIGQADDDGKYPMMDVRHFEVYAKSTKTRIVLLRCCQQPGTEEEPGQESSDTNPLQFTCHDIDWRGDADETHPPEVKFSNGIPDFGVGFDFYRTAVVMFAPVIRYREQDMIYWETESCKEWHYSMWLPDGYAPLNENLGRESIEEEDPNPNPKLVRIPIQNDTPLNENLGLETVEEEDSTMPQKKKKRVRITEEQTGVVEAPQPIGLDQLLEDEKNRFAEQQIASKERTIVTLSGENSAMKDELSALKEELAALKAENRALQEEKLKATGNQLRNSHTALNLQRQNDAITTVNDQPSNANSVVQQQNDVIEENVDDGSPSEPQVKFQDGGTVAFGGSEKCPVCCLSWRGGLKNALDVSIDILVSNFKKKITVEDLQVIKEVHKDCNLWWANIEVMRRSHTVDIKKEDDAIAEGDRKNEKQKNKVSIEEYLTIKLRFGVLSGHLDGIGKNLQDVQKVDELLHQFFIEVRNCKLSVFLRHQAMPLKSLLTHHC